MGAQQQLSKLLTEIERLRRSRAIILATNDQTNPPRHIEEKDTLALYQCLRQLPALNRLDLILHTGGGEVQTARKLVDLLRQKAAEVSVLVPYKARSAGALICLGANGVVMGPMSELSPIDPHIAMRGDFSGNGPKAISAEEVRLFAVMARDWFGVHEEDAAGLLALLGQKIFPTTLTSFYRATEQMRSVAEELFAWQRPDLPATERARVIHHLMHGFHSHDAYLNWHDAQLAGLSVQQATDAEETLLWGVYQGISEVFAETAVVPAPANANQPPTKQCTDAIIASTDLWLTHHIHTVEYLQNGAQGAPLRATLRAKWQREDLRHNNHTPPDKIYDHAAQTPLKV